MVLNGSIFLFAKGRSHLWARKIKYCLKSFISLLQQSHENHTHDKTLITKDYCCQPRPAAFFNRTRSRSWTRFSYPFEILFLNDNHPLGFPRRTLYSEHLHSASYGVSTAWDRYKAEPSGLVCSQTGVVSRSEARMREQENSTLVNTSITENERSGRHDSAGCNMKRKNHNRG